MSDGEIAYLAMVLTAFIVFISVVGFLSVWAERGNSHAGSAKTPHRN
jgi:hypothetical protein